jgi:hypothetical protein
MKLHTTKAKVRLVDPNLSATIRNHATWYPRLTNPETP